MSQKPKTYKELEGMSIEKIRDYLKTRPLVEIANYLAQSSKRLQEQVEEIPAMIDAEIEKKNEAILESDVSSKRETAELIKRLRSEISHQ